MQKRFLDFYSTSWPRHFPRFNCRPCSAGGGSVAHAAGVALAANDLLDGRFAPIQQIMMPRTLLLPQSLHHPLLWGYAGPTINLPRKKTRSHNRWKNYKCIKYFCIWCLGSDICFYNKKWRLFAHYRRFFLRKNQCTKWPKNMLPNRFFEFLLHKKHF